MGLAVIIFSACSSGSSSSSLSILLTNNEGNYHFAGYKVLNHPYKEGGVQQGQYRVHLLDKKGEVIRKVGFSNLNITGAGKRKGISFIIPLKPKLYRIAVYKLDGSSGHYRLDKAHPLFTWTLPDSLRDDLGN